MKTVLDQLSAKTKEVRAVGQHGLTTLEDGPEQAGHKLAHNPCATANFSTEQLPSELRHLQDSFNFTTMSIISSSKMEQKVRNLLMRTKRQPKETKPGVVILAAKADVASKMVGIVEIAKRTIQQEGGKWWQYSKLYPQMVELKKKTKKPKRAEGGKSLREWDDEQKQKGETVSEEGKENQDDGTIPQEANPEEDEDEDEGAFQTMGRRQVMAYDENRSKMRAIPIMTIYLSQAPVPALKSSCR